MAFDFNNKSLICRTKQFPVKGGFEFVNKNELIKYNILYDVSIKSEYLYSSKHCYKIIKNEVIISEYSLSNYCGSYVSSIDIGSLIYTIPIEEGFLTADCKFYDGNLENKLKSSLNISIN
tara:strand:- start:2117 stop:2476 length:360 start_codon:yes stop_codon:yes gene_type:complete